MNRIRCESYVRFFLRGDSTVKLLSISSGLRKEVIKIYCKVINKLEKLLFKISSDKSNIRDGSV